MVVVDDNDDDNANLFDGDNAGGPLCRMLRMTTVRKKCTAAINTVLAAKPQTSTIKRNAASWTTLPSQSK